MSAEKAENVIDEEALRGRVQVFRDRADAGRRLGRLLATHEDKADEALVLGIPAGGVPVAAAVADELQADLDVAVVSKITLPWSSEVGFGAVAFDGTMRINEELRRSLPLSEEAAEDRVRYAQQKVERRAKELGDGRKIAGASERTLILVDDGLASGFTALVAVEALKKRHPSRLVVAVPTAHRDAVDRLVGEVDAVYVANLRAAPRFAVAEAYEAWRDVSDDEVKATLAGFGATRASLR